MANQDMSAAKQALDLLSADPATRRLAENRIVWDWAYRTDMASARRGDKTAFAMQSEPRAAPSASSSLTTAPKVSRLPLKLSSTHSWPPCFGIIHGRDDERSHRYPSPVPHLDERAHRCPRSVLHLDERSNRCRDVVSDAQQRLHRCLE